MGVDVFFVLSGFLITTLLVRERDRTGTVSLVGFYARRCRRILPALGAFLLFVATLQCAGLADVTPAEWVASLVFGMNFMPHPAWELGHLWSLAIEEHFYIVWPLLFAYLRGRLASRLLVATLLIGPVLRWVVLLWYPGWAPLTDLWTPTRLDHIASGCLAALAARSSIGLRVLDIAARWWPAALLIAIGAVAGAARSAKVAVGVTPTVTALTITVLVWAAARRSPRWLEWSPIVWIGGLSYSLYLWQQPFLAPAATGWWRGFPANLALMAGAAIACHYFIERSALRIGRRSTPRVIPSPDTSGEE